MRILVPISTSFDVSIPPGKYKYEKLFMFLITSHTPMMETLLACLHGGDGLIDQKRIFVSY